MVRMQVVVVVLVSWAFSAHAQTAALIWSFDRSATPPPSFFVLTATEGGKPTVTYQVPPSAPGACARLPGGQPDDFCTTLPCPAPGRVVVFEVLAVWPDEQSDPALLTCWFPSGAATCQCQAPADATAAPQPVVSLRLPFT